MQHMGRDMAGTPKGHVNLIPYGPNTMARSAVSRKRRIYIYMYTHVARGRCD